MRICYILFFLLMSGIGLAQNIEENIYVATETFNANPNNSTLSALNDKIVVFETQITTKNEYYAFINLLVNKAYYLSENNKIKEAITTYEKAHQLYEQHEIKTYDIVEYGLIPLGILYHKTNAYLKAERIITYYIELAKKQGNEQQQITGTINLSKLYQSLNKHTSVINIVEKGLQLKGLSKQQKSSLNYIKRKSELLLSSNQKKLLLENDIIVGNPDMSETEDFQLNYETALKNGDYEKALSNFNRLKTLKLTQLTSARNKARFNFQEAQLYYLLGKNDRALSRLNNTLAILLPNYNGNKLPEKSDLYPENTFIDVFDLLAELQTDAEESLKCYSLSFYVAELLTEDNTSQESLILNASVNRNRSEKCISILYQLYNVKNETSYFERAFEYAERHKALALKWYNNKRILLEKNPTDSLLIKESELLQQQQVLTNRLLNRPINKKGLNIQDSLRLQLIVLGNDLKDLQKRINKKYEVENRPSLKQLKTKLSNDKACLVEYFHGKNDIYQFIISPNHFDFKIINLNASRKKAITGFIDYFNDASAINNNSSKFSLDAFNLYQLLQVKNVSSFTNVIIVPDGILNFIPFDALLTEATSSTSYTAMPFMVKNHRLAYNTSALFYLHNKPYIFHNSALGVFPVFEDSNQKLTHSVTEAESIDDEVNAKFLMYNAAKKQEVLEQALNYSILHLSTHANGGSFTIPAHIDFIDAKLYLNELYSLNLNNDLVVLSACETGVGMLQKGEGSMNLARGFKYAGVDNIIFSLWKINDLSTTQLMSSFYRHLSQTESAFRANHKSKLDYLNDSNISNIKKSPYYWSAFVYYGDLTVEKEMNYTKYIIYVIVIIGIGLILWFINKRKHGDYP